jgi:hypothetical protein
MMPQRSFLATAGFAMIVVATVAGCGAKPVDPESLAWRKKFLITEEPAAAMTLTELAARLGARPDGDAQSTDAGPTDAGPTDADPQATELANAQPAESGADGGGAQVSVIGRIFAGQLEPWDPGKAAFLIAELPDEGHGEGHDADNCPFCKRKAARAPTAMVQFVDDSGAVIPIDARKLLGVEKQDVVVIVGKAVPGDLNSMVIRATGLYRRQN